MSAPVAASAPVTAPATDIAPIAASAAPTASPAVVAGQTLSAAAAPTTTRTTILVGQRIIDMVLPSTAPIEMYVDDAVAVLTEILQDEPSAALAGVDLAAQGQWTFARPGAPPLRPDQSLDDAAVVDGSLLTLVVVSRTERYRPLVEDVIDAIAIIDESPQFDRAALYRFIGVAIPLVALAIAFIATLGWANGGHQIWWAVGLGVDAIALLAASWAVDKHFQNPGLSESLLLAAYPLLTVAVALAVPSPPPPEGVSTVVFDEHAPALAAAGAAVLLLTLVSRGGPYRRVAFAAFIAVVASAFIAIEIVTGYGWYGWVPGVAIMVGLFFVTAAAKLTTAVARIALPPIPAPGEIVRNEDLLDPVLTGQSSLDVQAPTWQAIIDSVPNSAARLTERSELAKQLLIGFVSGGALVFAFGAIAMVYRGHFFVPTLVVAGLVTGVCAFRSRLYAERWCAWALLAVAVVVPIGVVIKLSIWYPNQAWLFLMILVAAGILTLLLVAATSHARLSPVQRRVLELIDGSMVAAIIPMLLWVNKIYDTVRNIQF